MPDRHDLRTTLGFYELAPWIGTDSRLAVWRRDVDSEPFAIQIVHVDGRDGTPERGLASAAEGHSTSATAHARAAIAAEIAPRLVALIGALPEDHRPQFDAGDPERVREHHDRVARAAAQALLSEDPFARAFAFQRCLGSLHADRRLFAFFDDPGLAPELRGAEFAEAAARRGEAYLFSRSPSARSAAEMLKAEWRGSPAAPTP